MNDLEEIAGHIVDAAVKLHMRTGPGLMESVYATLLGNDLVRRGLKVERQKRVPLELEGVQFRKALRVDLLVDDCVVVEVKSADLVREVHWKQVLTYLRLLDLRLGFLINFNEVRLKDGLKRVVNRYDGSGPSTLRVR